VAWLGGGLWLVAREAVMGRVMRVLAFAAGAAGLVWAGWPGASSNSATPLNIPRLPAGAAGEISSALPRSRARPSTGSAAPRC